ncbi:hypothetical protein C0989_002551 [Termitomyces sp. Mn162]|nr:hypothetical protein C0989_002551 [Termitomyces sp. Mn162]
MDDVPSTLSQARIAQSLVKAAIAKHNDRYENVFLKADCSSGIRIVDQQHDGKVTSLGAVLER